MNEFGVIDYIVFISILIVSILIGIYHGFKRDIMGTFKLNSSKSKKDILLTGKDELNTKTTDYLTANKSMNLFPITMSLLGTCFSATALVGIPAETYQFGIQNWIGVFGIMIAPLIGAFITGPYFARKNISSVFEYFQIRYQNKYLRLVTVGCYMIRNFLAIAIYLYGPATSLSTLTNISNLGSIFLVGSIATFYTAVGGIKGVIWVDVFQTIIMFIGTLTIIIKGSLDVNGLYQVWKISNDGGRLNFFVFDLNPFIRQSNWSIFFGSLIFFSLSYGIDQQMIQRFRASKDEKIAQKAILLNIPGIFLLISFCSLCGLVIYANFAYCDPITISKITNPNQIVPYYIKVKLSMLNGMPGLILSAIFSACLSTVSSLLSSQVSILWEDVLKNIEYFKKMNDDQSLKITKIFVIIIGTLCTLFAVLISKIGANVFQLSVGLLGAFGTPIIGLFFLSYFFKMANAIGALVGTISSFLFVLWISIGAYIIQPIYPKLPSNTIGCNNTNNEINFSKLNYSLFEQSNGESINVSGFNKIYSISFTWIPVLGFSITIIVGLIFSFLSSKFIGKKSAQNLNINN